MLASQLQSRVVRQQRAARPAARLPVIRASALKTDAPAQQQESACSTSSAAQGLNLPLMMAGSALPFLADVSAALAKDGEYGLLEGRTFALVHPAVMGGLFLATGYAGYLGWQYRRTRELGEEIRALKAALPAPVDGVRPPSPNDSVIAAKEAERKELLAGNFRDKHWWWGSLLLASGVGIAIEGCVNTYFRTGRLFPGPHLYAGAAIVGLWAVAAALVPAMQKGDNNARQAHIFLNVVNCLLFAWQVPTGLEIVGKVFQFTSWP